MQFLQRLMLRLQIIVHQAYRFLILNVIVVGPTPGDNCAVQSVTNSYTGTSNASDVYPVGTTTITWTVTDIHGNTNTSTQKITVTENEKPKAICKPATVMLVNGAAYITVANVNNNSTDNCDIFSMEIFKSSFSCANIGANTVTLTVTDIHGNISTCEATVTVVGEIPTCTIASIPTSNTYTGGVSTNLYLGCGAQSTTLKVTPANGGPYTYSWSGSGIGMLSSTTSGAPVFMPTVAGSYIFKVVTTNAFGCITSCSITICVTDIRVPGTNGNNAKVYVCHVSPGNRGNANTLSISVNAVPAHLGNHAGDRLGTCEHPPCSSGYVERAIIQTSTQSVTKESNVMGIEEEFSVKVSPNPSTTYFTLKLESKYETPVNMRLMDARGRIVDAKSRIGSNNTIQIGHNYSSGTYYAEMIQGTKRKVVQLIKARGVEQII